MKILVTAGNTQTPIDEVRVMTNVFSGRTGSQIALAAHERGHAVTLLTSRPELVAQITTDTADDSWKVHSYQTFDDLHALMQWLVTTGSYDAIIHSAAVSDYRLAGTYAPAPGTAFDATKGVWIAQPVDEGNPPPPTLHDVSAGKVKSGHAELWMRLAPTPKLIDSIRQPWGFAGILVKFKLEVGPADEELLRIAEASRTQSHADLMVANTFSGMQQYAFLGPIAGRYDRIARPELATRLLGEVERLAQRS